MKLTDILRLETRLPLEMIDIDKKLLKDIKQNGIREPIEIRVRGDGSQIVWDGLHRLKIAILLNTQDIPVILVKM